MQLETWPSGKLGQFARRLVRVSAVTRVVGVLALVAGCGVMLFGCSEIDHRKDDAVAFGVLGLSLACIGTLVWAMGSFHATFGHSMVLAASIDERLDLTLRLFQRLEARAAAPPAGVPAPAPAASTEPAAAPAASPPVEPAKAAAPTTKVCAHCGETIRAEVLRCRYCMEKV
jgi:hypothetical protein